MNYPEEVEILDRQYWINKALGKLPIVDDPKKKKQSKKDKEAEKFAGIFQFAPEDIKKDEEIILLGLEHSKEYISNVDKSLIAKKEFVLTYIERATYPSFLGLPKTIRADEDIFLACFKKDHSAFRYYCWESDAYSNRDSIKKLIEINDKVIQDLSNTYKDDVELARMAIEKDPTNIEFLNKRTTEKILSEKEYTNDFLAKYLKGFPYISMKLRGDADFVLPYVNRNTSFLENVSKKLRNNKEFMSQFVNTFMFMIVAGDDLVKDKELMLNAVNYSPVSIYKIDKSLKNKEFYSEAIKNNPRCYMFIGNEAQLDNDLIYTLLTHDTYSDNSYQKKSTVEIIHKDKLAECREEYHNLNNEQFGDFEAYVRRKYINLYLNNNLASEDVESKSKRLKI